MANQPLENGNNARDEQILDELFLAYRESLPDFEPGAAFMPAIWAQIETRERSTTDWFGRMARALAMTAVAASLVLGLLASRNQPVVFFNGTFIDALADDHVADLEPLHLDRMSQLERQ